MRKEVMSRETSTPNPILSPAIRYGNLVFTSGTVGRDSRTRELVEGGITEQSRQILENLKSTLELAGPSLDHVLKATCFVADLDDRPAFNGVYQEYFRSEPPVRTCVQVARLSAGVLIEIDVIAGTPDL